MPCFPPYAHGTGGFCGCNCKCCPPPSCPAYFPVVTQKCVYSFGFTSGDEDFTPAPSPETIEPKLNIIFTNPGLGDAVQAINLLELYRKRNWEINVGITHKEQIPLWDLCGYGDYIGPGLESDWLHRKNFNIPNEFDWSGNKVFGNINYKPFPYIGKNTDLWEEMKRNNLKIIPRQKHIKEIRSWLANLPKPIVILHTEGRTVTFLKAIPKECYEPLRKMICDAGMGLVILGKEDPEFTHPNCKYWPTLDLYHLAALMYEADCFVGHDSGPFHMTQFFHLPQIFVGKDIYFSCVCLPRPQAIFFVKKDRWNTYRRDWNVIEFSDTAPSAEELFCLIQKTINNKYGKAPGRDAVLQSLVPSLPTHRDCFEWILQRKPQTVLEIGCTKNENDAQTTLFFGYIANLTSVDSNEANISFANNYTRNLPINFVESDSVKFLREYKGFPFDLVYLNNTDDNIEYLTLIEAITVSSMTKTIVIDETRNESGAWKGKGATAIPWLISQGWEVIQFANQVALTRSDPKITFKAKSDGLTSKAKIIADKVRDWLGDDGDWYLGFGGLGDVLLVLAMCYDNPKAKVVFFKDPHVTEEWFKLFNVNVLLEDNIIQTALPGYDMDLARHITNMMKSSMRLKTTGYIFDDFDHTDWIAHPHKYRERMVTQAPWRKRLGKKSFDKPVIVIHPSNSVHQDFRQRFLTKEEYDKLVDHYLKKGYLVFVIGAEKDYLFYGLPPNPNCSWFTFQRKIDGNGRSQFHTLREMLLSINAADEVLAVDSWFKTYSLLCGIPTKIIMTRKNGTYIMNHENTENIFLSKAVWPNIELVRIEDLLENIKRAKLML